MSDLQITHAGTVQTQDRQGPMNPTAPFGQVGSLFSSNLASCKPPLNQVFVAITIIEDGSGFTTLIAEDPDKYINTATAAHDQSALNGATSTEGVLGQAIGSETFPVGMTLYGRWTEIQLSRGTIVAYIG